MAAGASYGFGCLPPDYHFEVDTVRAEPVCPIAARIAAIGHLQQKTREFRRLTDTVRLVAGPEPRHPAAPATLAFADMAVAA